MNRVMSNKRLMILIQTNRYLKNILDTCESAYQLETRIENTNVLGTICLYEINWKDIYKNLKEGSR